QNYTVGEVVALMERIQSAALFTQAGYGADAARVDVFEAAKALPGLKRVYRMDDGSFPAADAMPRTMPGAHTAPYKMGYLAFTSGTTGLPKGVLHSDNTLLANGRAMVHDWHHDDRTVLYSMSPLSHHIATVAIAQSLSAGFELVVNDLKPGMK